MGLETELVLVVDMDPDCDPNVTQPVKFNPDVVEFVLELGPAICNSVEECRATLSSVGGSKLTPTAVARIIIGMIKAQDHQQNHDTNTQQSGSNSLWGEAVNSSSTNNKDLKNSTNESENGGATSWNGKNLVQAVLDIVPNFMWKDVFHELDFPGFYMKDAKAFRSLMETLRYGLHLQGQVRPDQFPVEAFYRTWNNRDGQISLLRQCLNLQNYDVFCFADVPYHSCPVETLKTTGDKSFDSKEISTWKSVDLVELLLNLSDSGHYAAVQEFFQFPVLHCPDILILSLIQLNTPMIKLRQELLTNLFPIFLSNHVNSGVVLQQAWHPNSPTLIKQILILSMADWYLRSDYDQAKLSRILDIAQDLKALPLLLNANSPVFIIDLACLASRREFLKLDKWLSDKIREHGEPFVGSVLKVLNRRVPFLLSKDDNASKTTQLPQEVVAQIVHCLQQCVGKVSPELSDTINTVSTSYSIFSSKNRSSMPPSSIGGGSQQHTLRSQRSLEPAFGISSPTTLFSSQNNDQLSTLGSTLAGLNLAGVGNSFGPIHGGPTPGSPSRLLGPNFNSQQNTNSFPGHGPNLQLGPTGPLPNNISGPTNNVPPPPSHGNPLSMVNSRLGTPGSGSAAPISLPQGQIGQSPGNINHPINVAGLFSEIQPGEISKEAEDEANSYFHKIYSKPPDPTLSTDEVIDLLKRFQDSPIRREREVFTCMLRNLFEEYKFFPQYPEKELLITAQLFGGIIEQRLVTNYLQLGVALRFVVDALKKPPGSKMYYFGLAAIDRFRTILKEYPQYCQHLTTISHFQEFPHHIIEYIEYGARSQEPPRPRSGPSNILPTTGLGLSITSNVSANSLPSAPAVSSSTPVPQKSVASGIAITKPIAAGPSISGRPSIANATNINTLLVATEKDDKVIPPPETIQDKIAFIFNNLNQMNLPDKCKELREIIGNDYWNWISQYLVMKRASIELNFHTLYANLLDNLKVEELNMAVLSETHRNIRILLRTDKSAGNFSDRALLKNLGHWLGMITLMKNKPIMFEDLDIKGLIIEAYRKGLQDLLYIVPFAAKIMESSGRSFIFRPPCPWTIGILSVLAELHKEPEMKLNLKFEIEVLCKSLNLEIGDVKPANLIKDESGYKIHRTQLSFGPGQQPDKQRPASESMVSLAQRGRTPEMSSQSLTTTNIPSNTEDGNRITPAARTPTPSSGSLMQSSINSIGGPVIGGLSAVQLTGGLVEPKFAYLDIDTSNLQTLLQHIAVNAQLPLFQSHSNLKQFVRPAVEKAIQDLLHPVVDRSIKYTVGACESIIKKDFALDPEENRMRIGAHHMMRYLTAGMAMITSRDHIFIAISSNLKSTFVTALSNRGASQQAKDLIEQASTVIAQENMDLACVFIQKTAVEKSLLEIDKRLTPEYEARKIARLEGRRYYDPIMLACQMERVPEPIRVKPTGVVGQQMQVYEEFSRNIPGFIPPTEGEVPFTNSGIRMSAPGRDGPGPVPSNTAALAMAAAGMPSQHNVHIPNTTAAGPGSNEELLSIYDKVMSEMDSYLQGLVMSHSPASSHLGSGVRALADMIHIAKSSRSVVAAISLLQKAVEGLLEGLAMFPSDPEIIRFRDAHLMVLKALQDSRAFGQQWVNRQVTKTLIETRDQLKFNVEAVDTLIRANLVNMLQFDTYLANALEKGNNLLAMTFAIQLVQMYLIDDRFSSNVNESDLYNTVDMLGRCAAVNRSHPDGLLPLMENLRGTAHDQTNSFQAIQPERPPNATTHLHAGLVPIPPAPREFDDPSGLLEKSEILLREWVRLYVTQGSPKDSNKAFASFINDLNASGILKSDEIVARFFRISIQSCVSQVYQSLQQGSLMVMRGKIYQTTDAFVRLVSLLIRHIGDSASMAPKINLMNKFLTIVAGLLVQDHEIQKIDFQQLPFHRLFIMLFHDLTVNDPVCDQILPQMLTGFSNTFHIVNPAKVPGFGYAWLEIIGHRLYIAKMLAQAPDQKLWAMYCQLLLDLFKFLGPFLRNAELSKSVQHMYRGTLRVLLVILHDFPDFLCDYCYNFLDVIPPNCIQMRNLVLSAFPRNMRLPDPFTANLKFETLADTAMAPRVLNNAAGVIPANFKKDLESYLNTRAPVTFLSELRTNLQVTTEPGTRYNIPLLNALVLTVGSQHISVIRGRGQTPNMSTVAHSSHMDIFQNLAVDLDTEGRYLFLNSLANQLRFPSSHTHYFSLVILYLFGQSNTEVVQEQITRVLLERLVVNRPHPWGLLVTFIELIKNSSYKFWTHEFVHCAPEVEKLFESVARSCMVTKNNAVGMPNSTPGSNGNNMMENTESILNTD